MEKEYKLAICFLLIVTIFMFFGLIAFREMEKISDLHNLVEKHGSKALTYLESARKNTLEIRELEGGLIGAKTENSIKNKVSSIIDMYKAVSSEIILYRDFSRNAQKEENLERLINNLGEYKKNSDDLISMKILPTASTEEMMLALKDGKTKYDLLQNSLDETLKAEYNTVVDNLKNAAVLFDNLIFKLLSLFVLLTSLSVVLTYLMIIYFSGTFKELDIRFENEKIKTRLMELFGEKYNSNDAEKLLHIVSEGLGAHASRLFEKKYYADTDECVYEKIGTFINTANEVAENDIKSFNDFKFFLGNTRIMNEFVLWNLEMVKDKLGVTKESIPSARTDFMEYLKKYGIRTLVVCPLMKGSDFKYVMTFYFKEEVSFFTKEKINKILETVSGVAVFLDNRDLINEMTKKNDVLNSQNIELEAYAHTVSHDLKVPLAGVLGFLEISKAELLRVDPEKKFENLWNYINLETQAAKKMNNLINDILTFTKAKNVTLKIEKLNMKKIIEMNLKLLEDSFRGRGINVFVSEVIPEIDADMGSISRVWCNLISNSIKYMGNGERREIRIEYRKAVGEHIFIFSDTGVGIAKRYQKSIFTPFFRTFELQSVEGSGVGLSIVKKIIERHHGSISFESTTGEGTTFYIKIPDNLGDIAMNEYGIKSITQN